MGKIIGPGSLNVDLTGFAPRLPVYGETVKGSTLHLSPGGKGNNQMTAAHRAGAEVKIIGRRGADALGQILAKHYATEGMSEEYVEITEDTETGSALIEIDEQDAQNRIIVIPAANALVERESVLRAEKDFADCDAVLTNRSFSIPRRISTYRNRFLTALILSHRTKPKRSSSRDALLTALKIAEKLPMNSSRWALKM